MPPKSKANRRTAPKTKPEQVPDSLTKVETASGLPQEAEDQFELELCWCINQLCTYDPKAKAHSMSGHTDKQTRDLEKSLSILRGNSAPLVKKRQIMRQIFGNYREKMVQDEQKLGKAACSVKFIPQSTPNKKSVFLKKANNTEQSIAETKENQSTVQASSTEQCANKLSSEEQSPQVSFKFNFQKQECL